MPTTVSMVMSKVWESSTVMTPSLPTTSMASAILLPTSASPAEMVPTEAICSLVSTGLARFFISATAALTALSIPRRMASGLAPAATFLRPSFTMAWASSVAVVVPSPTVSLVLVATSLTSWAPMFSMLSSSSISLATETPSLVIMGAPKERCRAT